MKVNGTKGYNLEVSMQESQDAVLLTIQDGAMNSDPANAELDEHGVNFLIKGLQSLAEDMKREREHREAERLQQEGRLH